MSMANTEIEFDQEKFDLWLPQVADASIAEEDMETLMRMCVTHCLSFEVESDPTLRRRLHAAADAYCHGMRITREFKDVNVDLETARGLVAKCKRGEPLSDEDIRLVGKRSSDKEADRYLDSAFGRVVRMMEGPPLKQSAPFEVVPIHFCTTLSDEQFEILAQSLFEQAVVQGTGSVSDKCWFAQDATECPNLVRKLVIAQGISLLTEGHDQLLRRSKLSPEERAREDWACEQLTRALQGVPPDPDEEAPAAG